MTQPPRPALPGAHPSVVGTGDLADAIRAALRPTAHNHPLVIEVLEPKQSPVPAQASPILTVQREPGRVLIGPLHRPNTPGCRQCLHARRTGARLHTTLYEHIITADADTAALASRVPLDPSANGVAAAVVADEYRRYSSEESPKTVSAVLIVSLSTMTVTHHAFVPDPVCPQCSDLPDDEPPHRSPPNVDYKIDRHIHRVRHLDDIDDRLRTHLVDPETGIVPTVAHGVLGGQIIATAPTLLPDGSNEIEPGTGRGPTRRTAELIALLESLERLGGIRPRGRRTVHRSTYRDLCAAGVNVLDPRTLGVHPDQLYDTPDYGFERFDEHSTCAWVYARSLVTGESILVPEAIAYYRTDRDTGARFVYEASNGCALGSSIDEAIFHALLELVERDAFLMCWNNAVAVPEYDLTGSDRTVAITAASITAATGHTVRVFDTTAEHGIPTAWAIAIDPRQQWPSTVSAAGAAPSQRGAVLNALGELGPIVEHLASATPDVRAHAGTLIDAPERVRTMDDHAHLFAHPGAEPHLDFLLRSHHPMHAIDPAPHRRLAHQTLSADLDALVAALTEVATDVLFIDQSTPEHTQLGLHCVKTLAPGLVPMTFGHHHRRTRHLPRLYDRKDTPTTGNLDRYPHPFP